MDPREKRLQLVRAGFVPVPLFGKEPPAYGKNNQRKGFGGWQKLSDVSEEQIDMWAKTWPDAGNTGILTERAPAIDIDIMNDEAADAVEQLARERFEEHGNILVRFGQAPKRAILLRTDEPFSKIVANVVAPDGTEEKIEVLADGQQLVVDGIHPDTQKPYSWHGGQPWETARDALPYAREQDMREFACDAVELLVTEHGYKRAAARPKKANHTRGNGAAADIFDRSADWNYLVTNLLAGRELHDSTVALAAKLAASGMADGAAINHLRSLYHSATISHDQRWQDRYNDIPRIVKSAQQKFAPQAADEVADAGPPPLKEPPDAAYAKQANEEPAAQESEQPETNNQEAEQDTGTASTANTTCTASTAQQPTKHVFDPWERYIVPMFPLDVLPEGVQKFIRSQSNIIGGDVSGLAMAGLATFSGALHHRFALKMMRNGNWFAPPRLWVVLVADPSQRKTPILRASTRPLVDYEAHLRVKYEHELRDFEIAKSQQDEGDPDPRKPDPPPRYLVRDTTVEKLGELLTRSDKGILVLCDELSGWLGSMERYANNAGRSDRAFWLQAYDGGPHSIDRIRRGELFIKNLSVSVLGCIQPQRLAEIQGLTSDGLLQRLLPVMTGAASFPLDCLCEEDDNYTRLIRELIFAKPARLIMNDAALKITNELRQHIFDIEQTSGGLSEGFQTFVGKLHGVAGTLALILHMAHDPQNGATYAVEERTVENVRRLIINFILPHAYEFYCGADTAGERLRRLASYILTSGKSRILASDLTANIADFRGLTLIEVNQRISPLVAAGWLSPADKTPVCRVWDVAPEVHRQLAERAKSEEARKGRLAELMRSRRKTTG
jgi:hypothetical protein